MGCISQSSTYRSNKVRNRLLNGVGSLYFLHVPSGCDGGSHAAVGGGLRYGGGGKRRPRHSHRDDVDAATDVVVEA